MRKLTATLLLASLFLTASAQKNLLPGYIVLTSKDTVRGLIDYRNWEKNPTQIRFTRPSSLSRVYTIQELEAFGIEGTDYYRKATLRIDANSVRETELPVYSPDLIKTQTVFLRILAEGSKLNLYEYVDFKQHYFIKQMDGSVEELIYKMTQDSLAVGVRIDKDFRLQLKKLLGTDGLSYEQSQRIDKIEYKERDLVKFAIEMNGSSASDKINLSKVKKSRVRFFAGAGMTVMNLSFESGDPALNSIKGSTQFSYIVTVGTDLFVARSSENLVARAEISVGEYKGHGEGESKNITSTNQKNEYTFRQINITPAASLIYHFLYFNKTKVYAGAAMGYNFSTYPEHTLKTTNGLTGNVTEREDFPKLNKGWLGIYGKLGISANSKFDIGVTARFAGSFVDLETTSEKGLPLSLSVLYRFN